MSQDTPPQLESHHLEKLALFPLPNATLYPGARLPLHIFEPRYRAMTTDAIEQDIPIAIVKLRDPAELDEQGRPMFESVGTAGFLTHYQQLADGRFNILLEGNARVNILEEINTDKSYRVGRAELLTDIVEPLGALSALMTTLQGCIIGLQTEFERLATAITKTLEQHPNPGEFTNVIASILIADPGLRQQLLEERHVSKRLEEIITRLTDLLAQSSQANPNKNQWLN